MSLTLQQQTAAIAQGSVAVTAGAGTGKTYMLVERYLYYLREQDLSPLEMVAVTFTEKAAKELRSRIRASVAQEMSDRTDILAELEAAQISTIHSLAARICRQHPEAAGVPSDFTILDDLEGRIWLGDRLEEALDKLPNSLYNIIPYSLLSLALKSLILDPISAQSSLEQSPQAWSDIAERIRQQALQDLFNTSTWKTSCKILSAYSGTLGDKIEESRQTAINLIENIDRDINTPSSLEALTAISLRGGSTKKWKDGGLSQVKDALKALKEQVKAELKKGLVTLELGDIDTTLAQMLPALKEAFESVQTYLHRIKYRNRVLTFSDLEFYAIQALKHPQICAEYRHRYKVFLVDEFQDTNPVQAELLDSLTQNSHLTLVGDIKQSIYGFRRADVSVFDRFRHRILLDGGQETILDRSFRTHQSLLQQVNQVFKPLLGNLHQNLAAHRLDPPHPSPHFQVYAVQAEKGINKPQRQFVEAQNIAKLLKELLESQTLIHDGKSDRLRPISPADIAILSRTWESLQTYSDLLETTGIPAIVAGGENLLEAREVKDAIALLRFLADPSDDLALVALLRSPFFAISDRLLFQIVTHPNSITPPSNGHSPASLSWWQRLQSTNLPELAHPLTTLKHLLSERQNDPPTRLLQLADRLTGYTATIAHLPSASRREADWRGFRDLLRSLESGSHDVFTVVRRLKRLIDAQVKVPRPPLDAKDAVALMTIHAAKGLEWPVVVVADLARSPQNTSQPLYFDPDLGVALKWEDDTGETQKPALYILLEQKQKQREEAEVLRVLYVALTRARDRLILTAADPKGGGLDRLRPGLDAAGVPIQLWDMDSETPSSPPSPPVSTSPSHSLILGSVSSGIFELPVTALSEYACCPLRFEFRFIQGHPGMGEGVAIAQRVGSLVHKALECNIREEKALVCFDPNLGQTWVQEAIDLALRFDRLPAYAPFRDTVTQKEQPVTLTMEGLTLNGVADLVGEGWVLDFKTDRAIAPQHHRFQLWAYAKATASTVAHIAYLRHDRLHTFSRNDLDALTPEMETQVQKIRSGNYTPNPSPETCSHCPYAEICEFAVNSEQ